MEFECTEEQFRIFENLVQEKGLEGTFAFFLGLVLLGFKPGTTPAVKYEVEDYRDEIRKIGLHIKRIQLEFVDFDELPDYMEELEYDKPYFVAREGQRLDMLKDSYSDETRYDSDFALFLGYPEEDVEWFVEEMDSDQKKAMEVCSQQFDDSGDLQDLVSKVMYVPRPTGESIRRAKQTGEKYEEALRAADRRFGSQVGEKLVRIQLDQ